MDSRIVPSIMAVQGRNLFFFPRPNGTMGDTLKMTPFRVLLNRALVAYLPALLVLVLGLAAAPPLASAQTPANEGDRGFRIGPSLGTRWVGGWWTPDNLEVGARVAYVGKYVLFQVEATNWGWRSCRLYADGGSVPARECLHDRATELVGGIVWGASPERMRRPTFGVKLGVTHAWLDDYDYTDPWHPTMGFFTDMRFPISPSLNLRPELGFVLLFNTYDEPFYPAPHFRVGLDYAPGGAR
jgi:hypothetical protein